MSASAIGSPIHHSYYFSEDSTQSIIIYFIFSNITIKFSKLYMANTYNLLPKDHLLILYNVYIIK